MTNLAVGQTVGEILSMLASRLEPTSETTLLDSQNLLAHLLDRPRSWVLSHPELPLTRNRIAALEKLTSRLEGGEPLPYVLGHWEFFGLKFEVTPGVLIPRPETEILIELALAWLGKRPECRRVADIGTGSGCIGIALTTKVPDLHVDAMDISPVAVEVARRNAAKHEVSGRLEITCGDLFLEYSNFNLVVANLPYIPTGTLQDLSIYGHEPIVALDGGVDGMVLIRRLLLEAPARLLPGGMLLVEIEASEGPALRSFAQDIFTEAQIHLHKDLAGHDRMLEIQT
jgi:release factor glutamine methyltransferase